MRDFLSQAKEFVRRTWIVLIVAAVIVVAGIASVETYRESVLEIESGVELVSSKKISLASEEIDTLNPIISQSEDMYYISKLIFDSLFDYNSNLNVKGELADDYDVNTDEGKISIQLKNVKWHNGEPLKADDVKFTVDAIKSAGKKSVHHDKVKEIDYVTVTGERSLEIVFKDKDDAALDNLTFPIVYSGDFTSPADAAKKEDYKPVGTGQYKYSSYNRLKSLKLAPNKDYYGDVSKKSIVINILPDRELAPQMLAIDSITCYIDAGADRKYTAEDREFKLYNLPLNVTEMLVYNCEGDYTGNKTVRKAIAHSINVEKVLENGYMGEGILTDTVYYPNFLGSTEDGKYYGYSINSARTLLKGIGYEDTDDDGVIEDETGEEIELTLVVNKKNSTRLAAARLIEDSLEEAGFNVVLQELSWKEYEAAVEKKEFDLLLTGYEFNEQYDLRFLFDGDNPWEGENDEILKEVAKLEELHTPEEYSDIYDDVEAVLMEELPYFNLCYRQVSLIGGKYFEADELPMFNDIYRNTASWNWQYEAYEEEKEEQKS